MTDTLTHNVRAIGRHESRDLHAVDDRIEARGRIRLGADGVDARIRPSAVRQLL
jgi:hypothetical protein